MPDDGSYQIERTEERSDGSTWGIDSRNGNWFEMLPPGTYAQEVTLLSGRILTFLVAAKTDPESRAAEAVLRDQMRSSPHRDKIETRVLEGTSRLVAKGQMSNEAARNARAWIRDL